MVRTHLPFCKNSYKIAEQVTGKPGAPQRANKGNYRLPPGLRGCRLVRIFTLLSILPTNWPAVKMIRTPVEKTSAQNGTILGPGGIGWGNETGGFCYG